jgi:hypothetical protein
MKNNVLLHCKIDLSQGDTVFATESQPISGTLPLRQQRQVGVRRDRVSCPGRWEVFVLWKIYFFLYLIVTVFGSSGMAHHDPARSSIDVAGFFITTPIALSALFAHAFQRMLSFRTAWKVLLAVYVAWTIFQVAAGWSRVVNFPRTPALVAGAIAAVLIMTAPVLYALCRNAFGERLRQASA